MAEAGTAQGSGAAGAAEAPWGYAQAIKDPSIEEWIDITWHRRLAFALIRPLQHSDLRITPTQLTLASLVVGLGAAGCYWAALEHGPAMYAIGTALLLFSVVLDCADGMLARLTGTSSEIGMLLDGFVDFVVGFAVWLALSHSALATVHAWWAWPSVILMFFGIIAHVAYYDHVKNAYVRLCKPKGERAPRTKPAPTTLTTKFAAFFYEHWYGAMSRAICGPDLDQLEDVEHGDARRVLEPVMRRVTWLGLGTHLFLMYTAALVVIFVPHATLVIAHATITVGLSVWMVFVVVAQRRAARRLRLGVE